MRWLIAVAWLTAPALAADVPYFNRTVKSEQDIGAINQNFRALSGNKDVLSQGSVPPEYQQCILSPMFCVNRNDNTIYVNSQTVFDTSTVVSGTGLFSPGDFKWKISQSSSCGSGWARADGSSLSTTTYSALFAQVGYMFGGSTSTFALPDMNNGEFVRAVSTGTSGGNLTAGMGTKQMDAVITHTHTEISKGPTTGGTLAGGDPNSVGDRTLNTGIPSTGASAETRPRNYAMIPCIYTGVP